MVNQPLESVSPIRVLSSDLGSFPNVLPLNPAFRPEASRLRLRLEIDCELADDGSALLELEDVLMSACPGLRLHQCRGPHEYRLFEARTRDPTAPPIDTNLALAHLIEHVMIDTVAFVTDAESVSGVTGAHTNSTHRFDIFVECPDESVVALASYVGIAWITSLLRGESVDETNRTALELARYLYRQQPRAATVSRAAHDLSTASGEIQRAVGWLTAIGYVHEVSHTMNFSGLPVYQLHRGTTA